MSGQASSTHLSNLLAGGELAGKFRFIGGSKYAVQFDNVGPHPLVRKGTAHQMTAWLDGFHLGRLLPESVQAGVRNPGWWSTGGIEQAADRVMQARADTAEYQRLLVDTSLVDQLRIQVLYAMESEGLNFKDLAALVQRTDTAVRDALSFGNLHPKVGSMHLFDQMIRACGRRFVVGTRESDAETSAYVLRDAGTEPASMTRMRALMIAAELRLIDGVSPSSANRARRTVNFTVKVAGREVTRSRSTLLHWLTGLADGTGDGFAQHALTLP